MESTKFNSIIGQQVNRSLEVLIKKSGEYATEDMLHNFKAAASLQNISNEKALLGFMTKHIVSIYDMVASGNTFSLDVWNEKIGDAINYLLILRAMVEEEFESIKENKYVTESSLIIDDPSWDLIYSNRNTSRRFKNLKFHDRSIAQDILQKMQNHLDINGRVSIGDFMFLSTYVDYYDLNFDLYRSTHLDLFNYGWTVSMEDVKIIQTKDVTFSYVIIFPEVIKFEKRENNYAIE